MGAAVGADGEDERQPKASSMPPQVAKRRAGSDTRWLELRGRSYYAVQDVPRPLQAVLGKRRMVRSLKTRDIHVAISRRHAALAEFQRTFARARAQSTAPAHLVAALGWRETLAAANDAGAPEDENMALSSALTSAAERIEEDYGETVAQTFYRVATGAETPLLIHVDAWLAEGGSRGPVARRTQGQYRSDLASLEAWTRTAGVQPTIEAFNKAAAGRYVTGLLSNGTDRKTANRKISAASSYWRWLVKRTSLEANPWAGQSLHKGGQRTEGDERNKRPFTDAEALTLLRGDADPELADAMRLAALSGMRIEELYRLTAADCAGGWFNVRKSKSRAGIRRVPIHSGLATLVARRVAGKAPQAFLMHEPATDGATTERSKVASQRFGRFRKRLDVDDTTAGRRQSRIDFHSWRRRFVTEARNAGIDRATVAAVVGHEAGNMTDDVYSGGPSEALRRACVEAVGLPE